MLDYAFTPRLLNSRNWRLLLGVNAEMALGQLNNGNFVINGSALEKLSYTGFTYGIKSGLIHTFSKGELELGVQTRRLNFKQKHTSLNLNDNSSSVNLNLDKT